MTLAGLLGQAALPVLRRLDPETAHTLGLRLLAHVPRQPLVLPAALRTDIAGISLPHPLGLAAGFDKDGVALEGLLHLGFAFVEAGTATLRPQAGNPRPRLFRLDEDWAVINRMGFNNSGVDALAVRLANTEVHGRIVGGNIGLNKDSTTPEADYVAALKRIYPYVAYVTVNVSSPNTPGLRALQAKAALRPLLAVLIEARRALADQGYSHHPLFLKIAPDLTEPEAMGIVEAAIEGGIEGLIVANTTIARPKTLRAQGKAEVGGLSGRPLKEPALRLLERVAREAGTRLALIGCGGIENGADAYARILAGASAVQVYTAFAYEGPRLIPQLLRELAALLERDCQASLAAVRGTGL